MPHVLVIDDDPITAALVAGVADADWIVQAVPDGSWDWIDSVHTRLSL
ncbi:MAG: hypothetical protein HC828_03225 [Blastochloris sp.]|nr:hypothetical protein [Blastochloris sp.]